MLNTAGGSRHISDDRQYSECRGEALRRKLPLPEMVATHRSMNAFNSFITGYGRVDREELIRSAFSQAIDALAGASDAVDSSAWTGVLSPRARLELTRDLIPLADSAVLELIERLSDPGPNYGPILDERKAAIAELRRLHENLGEVLAAIDQERFDTVGKRFAAEAVQRLRNVTENLREDGMPYAAAMLVSGIFLACGFPDAAGLVAPFIPDLARRR